MRKGINVAIIFSLLLSGCVVTKIRTMPTRVFDAEFDTVWNGVIRYLDKQKEPIITADKEKGIILTDWVIMKKVFSSKRYRYEIKITKLENNQIQVGIASPQQSYSMGDWEDLLPTERRANRTFRYLQRIIKQAEKRTKDEVAQDFKGIPKREFHRRRR